MLADATVTTILPVIDMNRARNFYERRPGLCPDGTRPDGKFVYVCGCGAVPALFPHAGGTRADHTAISFRVPDINTAILDLESHGVIFEDYDLPGLKTVGHVCVLGAEKAAWFKNTEGNTLCFHEDLA